MLHWRVLLLFFLFLTSGFNCLAVENPPGADDVNTLGELAKLAANDFYRQSFQARMRYEFADRFFSQDDRAALLGASKKSSKHMGDIIVQLEDLGRRMKQYPGKDWNRLFGRSGLYEKASNHLSSAMLSRFGIDYYSALAAADEDAAKELLRRIDSFTQTQNSFYPELVKGKTLALLVKAEPNYMPAAERVFSELRVRSDTDQRPALLASIERLRLESAGKYVEADRLANDLIKSTLTEDLEIFLPIAFLERRLGRVDTYNKLLGSNPRGRGLAADITLGWLESGNAPANPLDAALAAEAALRDSPGKHKELLLKLARENSSASPVVDYAAALTLADSNESEAVYFLIRAGRVLDVQSAEILGLSSEQIAGYAARLAYRLFVKDANQCEVATEAFENYFEVAGQRPEANLQYTYTQVLALCGEHSKAVDILRKIPPSAQELYPKAQLDLMSAEIGMGLPASVLKRCGYALLFSQYLRDTSDCVYIEQATALLQSYLAEIELLEGDESIYRDTIRHSKRIAAFFYDCIGDQMRASILAEFAALDAATTADELTAAEELLRSYQDEGQVDFVRARGRIAQRRGSFSEAARLWSQVAEAENNKADKENNHSWQWWRAKYYQLECAANVDKTGADVRHTIEILRNSYKDIPAPWAVKLELLEQKCGR